MRVRVPGKIFLLGEYLALQGGPALIASITPYFELNWNAPESEHEPETKSKLGKNKSLPSLFHPESPAGKLHKEILKLEQATTHQRGNTSASDKSWSDPFRGQGGFGASTAQFIALYYGAAWRLGWPMNEEAAWNKYRDCFEVTGLFKKKKLTPSGLDLIAQAVGGVSWVKVHMTKVNTDNKINTENVIKNVSVRNVSVKNVQSQLPLSHILIFQSTEIPGRKTVTHDHLNELSERKFPKGYELGLESLSHCIRSIPREKSAPDYLNQWGSVFSSYAKNLNLMNLELKEAALDREHVCKISGVYGAKGSGALLADSMVVLTDGAPSTQAEVVAQLRDRGHNFLGPLSELVAGGVRLMDFENPDGKFRQEVIV